ncbi:MAG: hypothetical protein AAB554_01055 [Patescibacteria group bacterium]
MKKLLQGVHGRAKRHYHAHYRTRFQSRAHFVFILDALLVSAAFGLLALGSYFSWFYHPLRDDFRLGVATVSEIIGGQDGEISVYVENVSEGALKDGRLTVHLPDVFLAADGRTGTREIEIGFLPAGTSAQYRFRGMPLGSPRRARVVAHFEAYGEDGRHDERLVGGDLAWERSLVETRFETPSSVIPGQIVRFRLLVRNGSALDIDDASVKLAWPDGFKLINATPPVYRGAAALGRLDAGEEAYVDFSARFNGAADLQRLKAELTGEISGRAFALYDSLSDVNLADAGLEVYATFADDASAYAAPGEEMPVIVRYRNDGASPLKGVTLGTVADPRTIASVRWEPSASVGELAPGDSGERTAFVRVLDPVSRYVVNPTLRVIPTARFSIEQPRVDGADIAGAGAERKISGAARLRTAARFFTNEGDQIGRGPLPPKVGSATRYWIFASLETGATELQGGTMSFGLPNGVAWTGRAAVTTEGDAALEGDRLVWHLGTVAPHAGLLSEAPSISFEVALTPTEAQIGTTPLLITSAAFTGTDAWTGADLGSNQGGLTTALPGDPGVNGRVTVRP